MNKKLILTALTAATMVASWGANATLEPRLNGQAYYDTETDLTWTTDTNPNGFKTINEHLDYLSSLTINGVGGWRIPELSELFSIRAETVDCTRAEIHFYCLADVDGPFANNTGDFYWHIAHPSASDSAEANSYGYAYGTDGNYYHAYRIQQLESYPAPFEGYGNYFAFAAWPVHTGDVAAISAVPEPSTYAMLLAGLGLVGFMGRTGSHQQYK